MRVARTALRRSWRALALVALLAALPAALAGCTNGGDRSNPAEGWTPHDGFVRDWSR